MPPDPDAVLRQARAERGQAAARWLWRAAARLLQLLGRRAARPRRV